MQLLAFGLLRGHRCCLFRIARFFPLPTDHNHHLRRLWRFLKNPPALCPSSSIRNGPWFPVGPCN